MPATGKPVGFMVKVLVPIVQVLVGVGDVLLSLLEEEERVVVGERVVMGLKPGGAAVGGEGVTDDEDESIELENTVELDNDASLDEGEKHYGKEIAIVDAARSHLDPLPQLQGKAKQSKAKQNMY
ncbi:MAG: hypothetical protein M1827_006296 [Pycnora praestabilis]|nr:MAG: hypothetical protein M1827_006296 [Pycnora praestabilis]